MIGVVLDAVLMLLLVAALAYGLRLERKLTALREGQLAFAGAVGELNAAAGRAQSALADLRAAGEDADLLHDRIIKARTLKTELETLMSRMERAEGQIGARSDALAETRRPATRPAPLEPSRQTPAREVEVSDDAADDRARRMQALADRIQGLGAGAAPGQANVSAILGALNAGRSAAPTAAAGNHAVQDRINRARRTLDEDLFAA
ncbi:DUF6468 domain-containing protein [Brevundimonas sp. VNH65]|uniref:DUF6468 domain-containing protein n=1 Tax=Brevundimonas sp. VNH65 TaxID=3400917 RepID=UPI003C0BEE26